MIDVRKLRAMVENYRERMTLEEIHVQLDALPGLLAVYEAACAYRDGVDREPDGFGSRSPLGHAIEAAVDATRKAG